MFVKNVSKIGASTFSRSPLGEQPPAALAPSTSSRMGSKPSVAAPAHAPAQPADPTFSPQTTRHRRHAQQEAAENISAAHSGQSAELLELFKHLAFKASTSNKHDTVVCVQEVLMQELGIGEYYACVRVLARVCVCVQQQKETPVSEDR